uniref:CIROZ beta domain-containing protein n=1 Tax=Otolemur garnettii TaxID=30611 RepID=H0X241_OTOGA
MKCPVLMLRLDYETVHCTSTFIQVSRPLPPGIHSGQTPWLLSLRGELVASLEDASLMGLYVDINVTTVTVQSPRQNLLQRPEVSYPIPVSSQPESEVLVLIPKQRLGLVKRGSRIKETLNLRFVRVHQSNIFTVTENRDFVMVSIPVADVLQVQQCQEGPGMQTFYRVDLSLEFVEMATPALWTVESFFQCVGSGAELPASPAIPRTTVSSQPPGPETPPAGRPSLASSQLQAAGPAAWDRLSWGLVASDGLGKKERGPLLQTAKPMGRSWSPAASLFPRATQHQHGPHPAREVGFPGHPPLAAVLPLESTGGVQAGPRPPRPVSPGPPGLAVQLSSEISPRLPPWRPELSKVVLVSGPSVTLAQGLETVRSAQDSSQPPRSPLLPRGLKVAATEPIQASEEMWPLLRPLRASQVEETLPSHRYPRKPGEMSFVMEVEGLPHRGPGLPGEGARGHLYLSPSEPSTGTEGLGLPILLGTKPTFTTPRVRQPDPSARGGALGPESTAGPEASSLGGWDRAQSLGSASSSLASQDEWGASHTSSSPSMWTSSLPAPTETSWPSLAEPRHPFPVGQGVLPQQNPTEPALASSPESQRPSELQSSMEGLSERPPC